MKTTIIFTAFFLGFIFSSNAQSTEPVLIKTQKQTVSIGGGSDGNPQAAEAEINRSRSNIKNQIDQKPNTTEPTTAEPKKPKDSASGLATGRR
ncbi:hypothetical protein [Flavobacterium ovatum]|uniref:hypothetical protein n=1 Tax=Flavobacterium ovatum TaxID=1928857 RepID=UPI00344DFF46